MCGSLYLVMYFGEKHILWMHLISGIHFSVNTSLYKCNDRGGSRNPVPDGGVDFGRDRSARYVGAYPGRDLRSAEVGVFPWRE